MTDEQTKLNVWGTVEDRHFNKNTDFKVVLEFLANNNDQWFLSSEICRATGIPDNDTHSNVRYSVSVLRAYGYPIVSSGKGFMFTKDAEIIAKCIDNLQKRVIGIQRAILNLQKYDPQPPIIISDEIGVKTK